MLITPVEVAETIVRRVKKLREDKARYSANVGVAPTVYIQERLTIRGKLHLLEMLADDLSFVCFTHEQTAERAEFMKRCGFEYPPVEVP
jgi:hypothetical protein